MEKDGYITIKDINIFKFEPIDSRMYIIVSNKEALIIDPCISEEAFFYLKNNYVEKVNIILTHEHYDHISGVNHLRKLFKTEVICSKKCSKNIKDPNLNLSRYFEILFINREDNIKNKIESIEYSCEADKTFDESFNFFWKNNKIKLFETPGNSEGIICVILNNNIIFTGDTLVNGNKIITRLPGGSKKDYKDKTLPFLRSISDETWICPGHGEVDLVKNLNFYY